MNHSYYVKIFHNRRLIKTMSVNYNHPISTKGHGHVKLPIGACIIVFFVVYFLHIPVLPLLVIM